MTNFVFIILVSKLVFCCAVFYCNGEVGRGGRYMSNGVEGKYIFIGMCKSGVVCTGLEVFFYLESRDMFSGVSTVCLISLFLIDD